MGDPAKRTDNVPALQVVGQGIIINGIVKMIEKKFNNSNGECYRQDATIYMEDINSGYTGLQVVQDFNRPGGFLPFERDQAVSIRCRISSRVYNGNAQVDLVVIK